MLVWTFYSLDTFPNVNPHYQTYHHKESYRYDAFGRRVWVELVRDTSCTTHDVDSDCSNFVRRVTWDGDQILRETQVAADTGTFNLTLEGGSVTYVHGGRIDEPLEAYKSSSDLVLPYTNWNGQFIRGTCPLVNCSAVAFPLIDADAYDGYPGGSSQGTWFGTLIKGQIDVSGYEYKRNRYYNPGTGRFNSEDPLGLAGGLNVYGYAKGDPTSYSDPLGLCPCNFDDFAQQTGRLLQPAQRPLEIAGTLATLPLMGAGAVEGISGEVLSLGTTLESGAGSGILTAAGVATRVAEATGGAVSPLAKSEGFKVTVQGAKTIVARIKSTGAMRVSIDRLGALTSEGLISSDRALTHLENLTSSELVGLVNKALDIVTVVK